MSLNAMDAVGIGFKSFTHYPTFEDEAGAIRPKTPYLKYYNDAEVKIVDLIGRCNDRSKTEAPFMVTPYNFDIASIIELKKKVENRIAEIEETKAYARKTRRLRAI
jgi:hypothetical protein